MNHQFFYKLTFLLAFSVLMLAGATAQEATAATRTVTKLADTDDNICNADCSLREAIEVAGAGDQIIFQPALTNQTITLSLGVITINKNLTITGVDNLRISGNHTSRVFYIANGANVTINNLGLKNGFAQFPDVIPSGDGRGGAILVGGNSTLALNDSKLYSNNSVSGGAVASSGNLKIKNTQISSNSAHYGGGVSASSPNTTVEITDSIIKYNQAKVQGGGLMMSYAALKMDGTSVYSNTTTNGNSGGGGLYLFGANFVITDSTISGNTSPYGGGIFNQVGNLSLINSTLSGNEATQSGGGLYHNQNGPEYQYAVLTLRNATITLNTASLDGGGLYGFGNIGEIHVGNSIIADNSDSDRSSPDVKGTINSLGYNLFSSLDGAVVLGDLSGNQINPNPQLAPLDNYGGKTKTHMLNSTSPAVNAGSNVLAVDANGFLLSTDQRGKGRFNGIVDIGAVERYNERIYSPLE